MKKMHILLMGSLMVMASPALAGDKPQLGYQNDNLPPSSATQSGSSISYTDYIANDDDHGADEDEAGGNDGDEDNKR